MKNLLLSLLAVTTIILYSCAKQNETEENLKMTIQLEDGLSYSYGPPVIQKPTHELYAEWLIQQGRNEEAFQQYQITLEMAPKRRKAMEGVELTQKV